MKLLGKYPTTRLRRNRKNSATRRLVAENVLTPSDLILPIFVSEGQGKCLAIDSMPGINRYSVDLIGEIAQEAFDLGIPAICIFPEINPGLKTPDAREAYNPDNLVCQAIAVIKSMVEDIIIICDAALDPFNSDGHDGILKNDQILNDETVEILCKQSIVQAEAGCDIIAPSDMMDGRVGSIREALDKASFQDVQIMSYAAKYASAFFGPFRDAIGSKALLKGDKKSYQLDPSNSDEAIREVGFDIEEGADMVMVKPGLPYLDIVQKVKETYGLPTFAYQVSGEYAMLKGAANNGWLENDKVVIESLMAFKRAGADGILTYFAIEASKIIKNEYQ